jgi:nucleoside-diphosphate-sugar epimerase
MSAISTAVTATAAVIACLWCAVIARYNSFQQFAAFHPTGHPTENTAFPAMPTPETRPRLFCFGLGYTGTRLAHALAAEGWDVAGTCRGAEHRASLRNAGIEAHLFDRGRPLRLGATESMESLAGASHVLSAIPPDEGGDPVLDCWADALSACTGLEWAGYLSATSVYGDRGGAWVDETTPPAPTGAAGSRRAVAEAAWQAFGAGYGLKAHIFRLAGIYGPGRSALDAIRSGTARRIVKAGHAFSRIHVDDIVQVLLASMARPDPGAIYNVCDDRPAPAAEVTAHGCMLLGVEPPPEQRFEDAEMSPRAAAFWADNKRVRNEKIKSGLGVELKYPDYRAGLDAILAGEKEAVR